MNQAIIYLHGFNSASLDLNGQLLVGKDKLKVLQSFCREQNLGWYSPNLDYRYFEEIVEDLIVEWNHYLDRGVEAVFMGSSLGGFTAEYLAMKTGAKVAMINPAIDPAELLPQFVGVSANYETGEPYDWTLEHCRPYHGYQQQLAASQRPLERLVLLDMGDQLLDASATLAKYRACAQVRCFQGGSHSFEHMAQALPDVARLLASA